MAKNDNLRSAKRAKNDEFYTQYADIEKELQAYLDRKTQENASLLEYRIPGINERQMQIIKICIKTPNSTSTLLCAKISPPPLAFSFKSAAPITTFLKPKFLSKFAHDGVLPIWAQGSRVTKAVAFLSKLP